ncbi:T9SS type A sorting domain-containing protein [Lentimicrobium sp. S6]|uniref:T9SS type A sorting domain-containing protein n=1 Tax=Lentimicrobium sp. S6 TaxID=2735872 RepID=UPI0015543A6E|nr:T9SS type A sorting domain-containing protein [Lentimicrobium sp. S6]NPD46312.1 T9SS type A sorting domain-containing protein [Lentimicrobium sp. S6]
MKKTLLLFALIFGIISLSSAQISKESYRKYMKKPVEPSQSKVDYPKRDIKFPNNNNSKNDISRIHIGKSPNAFSILNSEQRPLSFDWLNNTNDLALLMVFEGDPESYSEINQKGTIVSAYSFEGVSWDESFLTQTSNFITNPSAVFINPNESDDLEEFYSLVVGQDSINELWSNTAFVSSQINNNNYQENIYNWEGDNDWARSSMTFKDGEAYIFGQDFESIGAYGKNQILKHYRGTTNNPENGYDWEINTVQPDWLIDPDEGFAYALYTTWSAWSNDGSIGYMWMIGVTNESYEYGVYQPQVFYTTNKGESWNEIELNLEDHYALTEYLQPWIDENGNPGTVRPSFINGDRDFPGIVNYQGKLHIVANVYGSTKGDVLNPTDGNWVEDDALGGHLFEFTITPNGLQDIFFISKIKTRVSTNMFGNLGFDHRLQMGKERGECFYVVTWNDDVISGADSLISPDIFGASLCLGGGEIYIKNFTENTLYEGFYFYPYLAENIYIDGWNYMLALPMTTSVGPSEWAYNNPSLPIKHNYIDGLRLPFDYLCCADKITENEMQSPHVRISQNTPNPFSGETKIEITSSFQEPKEVNIEITDLLGHTVYQSFEGKIEEAKVINIQAQYLKSGVYFYTICVDEECQTKKMIVE